MKSILERIFNYVSDGEYVRNVFARDGGERSRRQGLPQDGLGPYAMHAICFAPPWYSSKGSDDARWP